VCVKNGIENQKFNSKKLKVAKIYNIGKIAMTWKTYTIESKNKYSDYIRFGLDGNVKYKDGSKNYIDCKDYSPFTEWERGDKVNIYDEKICQRNGGESFGFYDNVIYKLSSSSSTALARVQSDYSGLQTNYSSLQSNYSGLQRQLQMREDQIELGRTLLNNSQSLIRGLQNQLERKDTQLETITGHFATQLESTRNQLTQRLQDLRDLTSNFNNLQVQHANLRVENATNSARAQLISQQYERTYNELVERQQELRTLANSYNELVASNARNEVRAEMLGTQLEETEEQLIVRETQLETVRERFTNLQIEATLNERENERLRREVEERISPAEFQVMLITQETQLREKDRELRELRRDLTRVREELEERITPTDLQNLLFTHETEIREKEQQIQEKDREINTLREQLGQSRGERLNQEVNSQQQELESLTHRLMIDWGQVQILRDAYEQLVRARRSGDQTSARNSQELAEEIRQNLLQARVHIDDVRRIGRICEEIAETRLRTEQNQGQRLEARIQVPLRRY
jgi:hypothetical protein